MNCDESLLIERMGFGGSLLIVCMNCDDSMLVARMGCDGPLLIN
jgi:hypothetical protein